MFKEYKGKIILTSMITILPVLVGLILWNRLPDQIPTHWNAEGVVDGWSSKTFAIFAIPGFLLVCHLLCILASNADPKKKNYSGKMLSIVFWICPVIALLMMVIVYGTALGMKLKVDVIMMILMGVMFLIIGNYLPKCKQNYTMGVKLPWTLNDEENWNYTHRLTGKVWVVFGILMLLCVFMPAKAMIVTMIAVLLAAIIVPVVASYSFYRKKAQK